jgi:hypothetical protein
MFKAYYHRKVGSKNQKILVYNWLAWYASKKYICYKQPNQKNLKTIVASSDFFMELLVGSLVFRLFSLGVKVACLVV